MYNTNSVIVFPFQNNIYLLGILLLLVAKCQCQYCPTQKFTFQETIVTWSSSSAKSVTSDPPCTNSKHELVKRQCTSMGWYTEKLPTCLMIQKEYKQFCPPQFIEYKKYCITDNFQKWNNKCPFPNSLNVLDTLNIIFELGYTNFWLPVKRKDFGKFIWMYPNRVGAEFEHNLLKKALKEQEELNNCLIISKKGKNSYELKIVNCEDQHHQICIYELNGTFSPINKKFLCSNERKNICYYVEKSCHKLAEPTYTDNHFLKTFVKENICTIGLSRNANGIFQWSNSFPDYTDWKLNTDFGRKLVGLSKNGWSLYDDLKYGICEISTDGKDMYLTLQPNFKKGGLILTVYYPTFFVNERIHCSAVGIEDLDIKFAVKQIEKVSSSKDLILSHLSKRDQRAIYLLKPDTREYNYYFCQGVTLLNSTLVKTKKVLFGSKSGNEYVLRLLVHNICKTPSKCDPNVNDDFEELIKILKIDIFEKVRPIKIINIQNGDLDIIFHLRTDKQKISTVEYHRIYEILRHYLNRFDNISIISFKYSRGCLKDTTYNQNITLNWSYTPFGTTTMPKQLCLTAQGLPVTRKCAGDFIIGATWEKENGECSSQTKYSSVTKKLHELYLNEAEIDGERIINKLVELSKYYARFIPSDIYYISKILNNNTYFDSDNTNVAYNVVKILNNLIATNIDTLKLSNRLLNSTNMLLDIFEQLMEELEDLELDEGVLQFVTPNLFYQVSDLDLNNITGIAVIGNGSRLDEYSFQSLTADTNMTEILVMEGLEIASFIPEDIIEKLRNETNMTKIFIAVFCNNSLFVEDENQSLMGSKIISVSILGYDNVLTSTIPVVFKKTKNYENLTCSYWNFGQQTYEEKYPTKWANDGGLLYNFKKEIVCAFTHLTHFALLLGEESLIPKTVLEQHDDILSIITTIGCSLSVLGITAIVVTTILFKIFRQKIGTKILLNLCCSTVLQITVMFIADYKEIPESTTKCIILGAFLHYATISSFCWMLVVAYLQYLRFVKIVGGTPNRLLLKSCVIGWIIPLIPVCVTLLWDPGNYNPFDDQSGLCYPHGIALYVTVNLPVILIIFTNLVIFCLVVNNITRKAPSKTKTKHLFTNQLKLAILLFFLLGLTWIFGLLAKLDQSLIFLYLFCSTSTLQGFVLFIFYVLLDGSTRKLWLSFLKPYIKISGKKSGTVNSSHELNTTESRENNLN